MCLKQHKHGTHFHQDCLVSGLKVASIIKHVEKRVVLEATDYDQFVSDDALL